jgi:TRAP transporter TAXI family solute receptor
VAGGRLKAGLAAVALGLLLVATACGASAAGGAAATSSGAAKETASTTQVKLIWQAGALGGGWYQQAGGIAQMLEQKIPGLTIKVIPGGGLANVPAVNEHKVDLAFGLPPFDAAGYNGTNPFSAKMQNFRAIASDFGVTYIHFFVPADSKYQSISQIFKSHAPIRIAVPQAGSSDQWVFEKMLAYYHVSDATLQQWGGGVFNGSYDDIVQQYKNRNADAVWVALAIPGAAVDQMAASRAIRFLPFSAGLTKYLEQFGLQADTIPAGAYKQASNDSQAVPTVSLGNEILVSNGVPEQTVYEITKAIIDNVAAIKAVSPSFASFSPSLAAKTGVPLAAGAKKAYQEAGIQVGS